MYQLDYPYDVPFEMEMLPEMAGFGAAFALLYMFFMFLSGVVTIVSYILSSLGMYTIANRRGIRNGWLAWVPVGNLWILGSISDQYQYVVNGKIKNRRKVMLALGLTPVVMYFIMLFGIISMLVAQEGTLAILMIFCVLLTVVAAITLVILQFVALNDLYKSCDPSNAGMYLVLSILFNITLPFFVFACRNKDKGMPPRKQPVQPVNVYPTEPVNTYPTEPVIAYPTEPVVEYTTEPVEEGFAQPEEFVEE